LASVTRTGTVAAHIEARRSDPDFRRRLKASIERNREILERLAR
jgi:hypothetical protein